MSHADKSNGKAMVSMAIRLDPLFNYSNALSASQKNNVMKVKGGRSVPEWKIADTCMQPREIWTVVTYPLSATRIDEAMQEQAFRAVKAIFTAGLSMLGYCFLCPF